MKNKSLVMTLMGAAMLGNIALFASGLAASERETIRFGVLPINQPKIMAERFEPLMAYLEKKTGYDFEMRLYETGSKSGGYTAAVRGLLSGETPLAFLAPVTLSQARHHNEAVKPLVCAVRGGSATYVGQIAVRKDSEIQKVEDLIGRRIIGASPSSTSGNLMPSGMLVKRGIDKSQFAAMDFAGGHDKAAKAVLKGDYDACWINDKNFQKYKEQGKGLRAIWTHAPVPEMPIAVNTRSVKPEVLKNITTALLEMHTKDLEAMKAIDPKYEKWVTVTWEAYQPVKETIDRVHGKAFYALKD